MVAPTLASDHPGLEVLAEVAKVLAAGRPAEEGLAGVVSVLRRGLALRRCRLWLRSADGARYLPIATPGDEVLLPGFAAPPPVAQWVAAGAHQAPTPGGTLLRLPLLHDGAPLGCFEVVIPEGRHEHMAHDVLIVVAQMLAPVLAATELSQDLASEVALRTRELEAQRNFAARIIDSLPLGLYVIDREYQIRAWNRKRETGTQGVSREDALGRGVFEVLDRQPRELLQHQDSHAAGRRRDLARDHDRRRRDRVAAGATAPHANREARRPGAARRRRHARDQQSARDDSRLQRSARPAPRRPAARRAARAGRIHQDHRRRGAALPAHRRRPAGLLAP